MTTYRIDLTPDESYFFGGENTFGENNSDNYFVRSVRFPQQTTLLGTLRFLLLKHEDLMDKNGKVPVQKKALEKEIIGTTGFSPENDTTGYGKIKRLSPVFINGADGDYVVQSREFGLKWVDDEFSGVKAKTLVPLKYRQEKGISVISNEKKFIPRLEGFDSKTTFPDLLLNLTNGKMRFFDFNPEKTLDEMNGIFVEHEQIGIRIPKKKENKAINKDNNETDKNEKGLYKQVSYQLREGFCFRFFADIDIDLKTEKLPEFIKMGASQSWFRLKIENVKPDAIQQFDKMFHPSHFSFPNSRQGKIVLQSDSFVNKEFMDKISFAVSDIITIKYLYTPDKNGQFVNQLAGFNMDKSEKFYDLLKRGTVLFVDYTKKEDLLKEIKGEKNKTMKAFHLIGYNYAI